MIDYGKYMVQVQTQSISQHTKMVSTSLITDGVACSLVNVRGTLIDVLIRMINNKAKLLG